MNEYNENGEKHGPWEYYHNGKLWYKANYINGKLYGLYEWYSNGKLCYKANYINGNRHGIFEDYCTNEKLDIKEYYL